MEATLGGELHYEGKGLHTGAYVHMTLRPSAARSGVVFRRGDLPGAPTLPALAANVSSTQRGTVLTANGAEVHTIEHLMSALRGCAVDNIEVILDGPEVPILDGSAKQFLEGFARIGRVACNAPRRHLTVTKKVEYTDAAKGLSLVAEPCDHFEATVRIAFDGSRCVPEQTAEINDLQSQYPEVASARTFVFLHEIEPLLQMGLIKGGDLANAIVFVEQEPDSVQRHEIAAKLNREEVTIHPSGVLNDRDLQWPNEPARHKMLDLIGDLALVGAPIRGRITAVRSGHAANTEFAKLLAQKFAVR